MSFDLFGFDFYTEFLDFGIWFLRVFIAWNNFGDRSLFYLYYDNGQWSLDLLFFRIIVGD